MSRNKAAKTINTKLKPENYVPQHPNIPEKPGALKKLSNKLFKSKLGTKFSSSQERTFGNVLESAAAGYFQKSLDTIDNFRVYGEGHAEMMGTVKMIKMLKQHQVAAMSDKEHPTEWKEVKIGDTRLWVPKVFAEALSVYNEQDFFGTTGWLNKVRKAELSIKVGQLFGSIFHAKNMLVSAFNAAPTQIFNTLFKGDMDSETFKANEVDFAFHGGD